ncbi:MAG TPA: VOC family protein [Gaiellales bacterium]|nr:VOC family protein [Gaiellales bacterium]
MSDLPTAGGEGTGPRDPEQLEAMATTASAEISPETHMGAVHLTVADLGRSIRYYGEQVGLDVIAQNDGVATLGTDGRGLLVLTELADAPPSRGHTGLYHLALLVPERDDLARWLAHAARDRVSLVGLSDHYVSEALYLRDPDHHGIEIYWDRPREIWQGQVGVRMTTEPLDVENLLGELDDPASEPFEGLPAGTIMGHVHLQVSEIDSTVGFYRDLLGFGLMAQLGASAAFLAAGGYHHHLGANTWESRGASPPPAGTAALRHATIVLPDDAARDRVLDRLERGGHAAEDGEHGPAVSDPSGNRLVLSTA